MHAYEGGIVVASVDVVVVLESYTVESGVAVAKKEQTVVDNGIDFATNYCVHHEHKIADYFADYFANYFVENQLSDCMVADNFFSVDLLGESDVVVGCVQNLDSCLIDCMSSSDYHCQIVTSLDHLFVSYDSELYF